MQESFSHEEPFSVGYDFCEKKKILAANTVFRTFLIMVRDIFTFENIMKIYNFTVQGSNIYYTVHYT